MVKVSIDIDGLRGSIKDLDTFWDKVMDQWTAVGNAAASALASTGSMSNQLSTHLNALTDLKKKLQERVDLAIIANGADSKAGGTLSFDVPDGMDTEAGIKQLLGQQLSRLAQSDDTTDHMDKLQDFETQFERYSNDPEVMSAFFTSTDAGDLYDFMDRVTGYMGEKPIDLRQSVLADVKVGLHTADASWSKDQSAKFAQDLVSVATDPDADGGGGDRYLQYSSALSYLLYDSHYSDAFLSTAAGAIDQYERVDSDGTSGLWSGRMMGPNSWGTYFPESSISASWDPAVSLMSALGNNANVSLDFFSDGGGHGKPTDREMYWIHDRKWSDDQFSAVSQALDAATTDPSILADPTRSVDAAVLASHTVNLLGNRSGADVDAFSPHYGDGNSDAPDHLAHILATYMNGADVSADNKQPVDWNEGDAVVMNLPFAPGQALTPLFNKDSLSKFITVASSSDSGAVTLRGALDAYADRKYALALDSLDRDGAAGAANWATAYQTQGGLEGLFVKAVGDAKIGDAKDADESREFWISLASDGVGLIPFGSAVKMAGGGAVTEKLVSFAIDQGRSAATDSVKERFDTLKDQAVSEWNGKADESLQRSRYAALQAMAQHGGYLEPDGSPLWHPDGTMLSWSELQALPSGERATALSAATDNDTGVGTMLDPEKFDQSYQSAFDEYFN